MRKRIETALLVMGTLGFWGIVYPDMCFTNETCRVVYLEEEAGSAQEDEETDGAGEEDLFYAICHAGQGQIHVKSKLLEALSQSRD